MLETCRDEINKYMKKCIKLVISKKFDVFCIYIVLIFLII